MSAPIADLVAFLMSRGLSADDLRTALSHVQEHVRDVTEIHRQSTDNPPTSVDSVTERRRAKDRDRQRIIRDKRKRALTTSSLSSKSQGELPKEVSKKERAPVKNRGERLASDWRPSPDDFEFAHAKGLQHSRIATEAEKFRNYWTAKSGAQATKVDWPATWRNWILNTVEREGKANGKRTVHEAAGDLVERVRAFNEPAPDLRDGTRQADVRLLPSG